MERILIIGASGGIGAALADHIGVAEVVRLSRSSDGLDVTNAARVDERLFAIQGPFDAIVIATGTLGEPEKSLAAIDATAMAEVMAINAIGPALILRHVPRLLGHGGRVAVLSARVGSIGDNRLGGWHSYRASKAALNQIVRGAAIELKRTHKRSICVAMHPGTVDTPFTKAYLSKVKSTPQEAATKLWSVIRSLTPDNTGQFYDAEGLKIPW